MLLVQLHQRYFGFLEVHSMLVVRVAADGRICAFEERWNGAPLLGPQPLLQWVRRVNGLTSAMLTPILIR